MAEATAFVPLLHFQSIEINRDSLAPASRLSQHWKYYDRLLFPCSVDLPNCVLTQVPSRQVLFLGSK